MSSILKVWWLLAALLLTSAVLAAEDATPLSSKSPQSDLDDIYWDSTIANFNGGLNGPVTTLAVYGGKLIVAGDFTTAGGIAVSHIAAWDGQSWSALGTGLNGRVLALTAFDGRLIAGGEFDSAGGLAAQHIAAWDGNTWSPLGDGVAGVVAALAEYDSQLVAGYAVQPIPQFSNTTAMVSFWDGSSWILRYDYYSGGCNFVGGLCAYQNKLYVSISRSDLDYSGGSILAWDGSSWTGGPPLGGGVIKVYGGRLLVRWDWTYFNGPHRSGLGAWDGSTWFDLISDGFFATALEEYHGLLATAGNFQSIQGTPASHIATSADFVRWSPLGSGTDSLVSAMTVYNGNLVAGGRFVTAGGKVSPYLAVWTKQPYSGPVWHVTTTGNDTTGDGSQEHPFATIQHGIDAAFEGDTVLVAPGTYIGDGNHDISFRGKNLVVKSQTEPSETIIDGGGCCCLNGNGGVSGFVLTNGETAAAKIEGLTITGCSFYHAECGLVVSKNSMSQGSAIICYGSSPTIRGCIISGNEGAAGGIFCENSSPHIVSNRISGNTCRNCVSYSHSGFAGGIACFNSHPTIEDNVIADNGAWYTGGGIFLNGSSPMIRRNLIVDNVASFRGAAIECVNGSSPTIVNNTIAFNREVPVGDCLQKVTAKYDEATASSNPIFENCIVAFNDSNWLGCSENKPSLACCVVYGNEGGDWAGCLSDQEGINGNVSADPLFCDTTNSDFHLSGSSPCAPANNSSGELIGALDVTCSLCGDFDNSGIVDIVDVVCYINWMFSHGPATENAVGSDYNCDGRPNIADAVYMINYIFRGGPQPCEGCK